VFVFRYRAAFKAQGSRNIVRLMHKARVNDRVNMWPSPGFVMAFVAKEHLFD
jgi:hypothetical protein